MSEETKGLTPIEVEADEEIKRKVIFISRLRNEIVEDDNSDDYNELILDENGRPKPKLETRDGRQVQVIEKTSVSVTPAFITWLDVQKLKYGNLEMRRGDLLLKMIYDHPKLSKVVIDDGSKIDVQLVKCAKSLKDTAGIVLMRAFKAHKNFNYEKYQKGIKELIADCEG